jgi:hypothetical protein
MIQRLSEILLTSCVSFLLAQTEPLPAATSCMPAVSIHDSGDFTEAA